MQVDEKTLRKVASTAKLTLTEKEAKKFQKDLNDILHAFKDLDKADPKTQPSFQPLEMKNVMREDIAQPCLSKEDAFKNTKHEEKGFFKGPSAV